jgi:hypothetical protein
MSPKVAARRDIGLGYDTIALDVGTRILRMGFKRKAPPV